MMNESKPKAINPMSAPAQQSCGGNPVARQIVARGEIPFLHVFSNNDSAIALYRRQGMEIRRRLHVTVLQKRT